jgi:hypothetical protein
MKKILTHLSERTGVIIKVTPNNKFIAGIEITKDIEEMTDQQFIDLFLQDYKLIKL